MAKPKFLFDNRFDDAVPAASSTAPGDFNVLNLRAWRPHLFWKPNAMPATVTVNSGGQVKSNKGGATCTFTRAGAGATRVNGLGLIEAVPANVPRFDFDPVTKAIKGLLVEDASTNVVVQSQNFGATWAAVGTPTRVAANVQLGALVLDLIGDDDAAGLEYYNQNLVFTGNAAKAVSLFVKAGTSASSVVRLRDTTAGADRLLAAITWPGAAPLVTMTTGTLEGIDNYGGGIYRIRLVTTAGVLAANVNQLAVFPAALAALGNAETGNINVGGVQAENALFCSSYIPTVAAAVARNAEVPSVANIAGFYNAAEGTVFCEATTGADTNAYAWAFNDGTGNERIGALRISATQLEQFVFDGGVAQAQLTPALLADYTTFREAIAWKANDFAASVNGSAPLTDSLGTLPTVTQFDIGCVTADSQWSGHIRKLAYYDQRLSNADLQTLSRGGEIATRPVLVFDFTQPMGSADALLLYAHDLATQGATVEVRGSMDNFATSDVLITSKKPQSNDPLLKPFGLQWWPYWRLTFTGAAAPSIAIAVIGASLESPVYLGRTFDPTGREVEGQTNRSEKGHPLGRIVYFESWAHSIMLEGVSWGWVRDYFLPAWKASLRSSPFAFAWDSDLYPEDVRLVQAGDKCATPHRAGLLADITLDVVGVAP